MRRYISNLISILVVIAIVIGVGVAIGSMITRFVQAQSPKKGVLSISSGSAVYDPDTYTLWITIRGVYQGAEPAQVTGFEVKIPGTTYTVPVEIVSGTNLRLEPNSYLKIVARAFLLPPYISPYIPSKLLVTVRYCFEDGTCLTSSDLVVVRRRD